MLWRDHSKDIAAEAHAILGGSNSSWLNYDEDTLREAYRRRYAQAVGTLAHDYARAYAKWGQKPKAGDKTGLFVHLLDNHIPASAININSLFETWRLYVTDVVQGRMVPEQVLYYSPNCFGTADAISFRNGKLKIFDLKTGEGRTSSNQLMIYAAQFCLEYGIKPGDIDITTRIYQKGTYKEEHPEHNDILPIMDRIQTFDHILDNLKQEGRYEI